MSATEVVSPPRTRPFFRYWFPRGIVTVAILAWLGIWLWPGDDVPRVYRVNLTVMTGMLGTLLGAVWLLFFSGLRWWLRPLILLAVAGAMVGSIREVSFDGDLVPIVQYRWSPRHDEILEANRVKASGESTPSVHRAQSDRADNFPAYRGTNCEGIVQGPPLARDWKSAQPKRLWNQPVGAGYAAFAVVWPLAVTIEQRRDTEAIVAYDATTGQERWNYSYPAHFKEVLGGDGPRATPTIAGGDVYSLGATGVLACLELHTGKLKWSVNILESNKNLDWGMSGSPLVYEDLVVVSPGVQIKSPSLVAVHDAGHQVTRTGENHTIVALDRKTGKKVWGAGQARGGYSSPMLATIAGQCQIVLLDGEGVAGYDAKDGHDLWRYPFPTEHDMNIAQPILLNDDRVFISASFASGCAMLKITRAQDQLKPELLWKNRTLRTRFTSAAHKEGYLYGLDEGILTCVDAKDGKRLWKDGRYGNGQLLLVNGELLILAESGKLALVEASPEKYREITSFQALDASAGKSWNTRRAGGGNRLST